METFFSFCCYSITGTVGILSLGVILGPTIVSGAKYLYNSYDGSKKEGATSIISDKIANPTTVPGYDLIVLDPNIESEYLTSVGSYDEFKETDFMEMWPPGPLDFPPYALEDLIEILAIMFPTSVVTQFLLCFPWEDFLPELYELLKENNLI